MRITAQGRLTLSQQRPFIDEIVGVVSAEPEAIKLTPMELQLFKEHKAEFFFGLLSASQITSSPIAGETRRIASRREGRT